MTGEDKRQRNGKDNTSFFRGLFTRDVRIGFLYATESLSGFCLLFAAWYLTKFLMFLMRPFGTKLDSEGDILQVIDGFGGPLLTCVFFLLLRKAFSHGGEILVDIYDFTKNQSQSIDSSEKDNSENEN